MKLDATELRVLGCLIEKAMTTPEYYPMTLNALTNACNQKSNRDPVLNLSEADTQNALGRLISKHLVMDKTGIGGRVRKFGHRLTGTLSQEMDFSAGELAILAELMLRGPQTAGELRSRAQRMHAFANLDEVLELLTQLHQRNGVSYVEELPREPGRRENRFRHLLGDDQAPESANVAVMTNNSPTSRTSAGLEQRLADLEQRVAQLETLIGQTPS